MAADPSAAKERAERFASEPYPTGRTASGRTVILCYCGGGDVHEWYANGGGARIFKCPAAPIRKPEEAVAADRLPDPAELREPGPVTWAEAIAMLASGDYDTMTAGEFAKRYRLIDSEPPVSAAVSPAEPSEAVSRVVGAKADRAAAELRFAEAILAAVESGATYGQIESATGTAKGWLHKLAARAKELRPRDE